MLSKWRHTVFAICLANLVVIALHSQTIEEKKTGFIHGESELSPEMQNFLVEINKELKARKTQLLRLQDQVMELYLQDAPFESYQELLLNINDIKANVRILQESWREMATKPAMQEEGYALWHHPETTLEQLVIDYGSLDYVYLIPLDIAKIKVSISSNIPIPHVSWGEMLEQILLQNGVGIKELNPYLRELYPVKENFSNLKLITANPLDLEAYPSNDRVSFVLSPEPTDVQRVWYFLEKFVNPNTTVLQRIGRTILIVGEVSAVKDLLKIYAFVEVNKHELDYRAIPLFRVDAEDMAKILKAIFEDLTEDVQVESTAKDNKSSQKTPSTKRESINALHVIALPKIAQAVFLIGTQDEIRKAEQIIHEVESQVGEARERSIFWYNVKHSDPEELAEIMEKIYLMMVENRITSVREKDAEIEQREEKILREERREIDELEKLVREERRLRYEGPPSYFQPPFYQLGDYTVNPRPIETGGAVDRKFNVGRENFIVDPKSGALVMVVEADILPQLKEVIKKLDVPTKMVQIEVLLFERRLRRNNSYGLNLLKIGDVASQTHQGSAAWSGGLIDCLGIRPCAPGVFEFLFSREKTSSGIPAFDLAYQFLMSQDDISLNASPSVVTVNQTEALIAIKDELSIRVGTTLTETPGITGQDVFTRAQYGITIKVTPTIHITDEEDFLADPTDYITLVSEITFDTFPPGQRASNQPQVNRRQIINEVRIPDGQAVIIGGLRRKQTDDSCEKIPFLGEIPGIGKLFSTTRITDDDTEMIIFMTPKIVADPKADFARLRLQELCKRPGDLPAFLCKLNTALDREKNRLFQGYMSILFGRPGPRYICEEGEYDGR